MPTKETKDIKYKICPPPREKVGGIAKRIKMEKENLRKTTNKVSYFIVRKFFSMSNNILK